MTAYEIVHALGKLDRRLEQAVSVAQATYGPEALADSFRGLHITQLEVGQLLARNPAEPLFAWEAAGVPADARIDCLDWLAETFGLSAFELDVLLIGLAPELDPRYERIYAFLQDDVARRRPSVDLALNLLCQDVDAKLSYRAAFASDAPLVSQRLINLFSDANQVEPSLLAHSFKVDDQIVRLLLGHSRLDGRLASVCQLRQPQPESAVNGELEAMAQAARADDRPLRLVFQGLDGAAQREAAEQLADAVACRLLSTDVTGLDIDTLKVLVREAWFLDAVLYVSGLNTLQAALQEQFLEAVSRWHGMAIFASPEPWQPTASTREALGLVVVPFGRPGFKERRAAWQANLELAHVEIPTAEVDILAGRFRMSRAEIAESVAVAAQRDAPTLKSLLSAARAQSGRGLTALADKITPVYHWPDIVLPDDAMAQLGELCQRVSLRHRVLDEWGFDAKLSLGKGVNTLFAGPSGTGKTMAAEVIANELGLDLYRINLAGVVSKYIGETEKNLDRIFGAAEDANAILFFDEADALFGKRSEVRDSHDRYANIEISYLLQKMEQYDGLTILATNLRGNLDEAFTRRMTFAVHFPFPDEAHRSRIWCGVWPASVPLGPDVDLSFLAREFPLTGGSIRNIALAAAFLAAEAGVSICMRHLLRATRREYQKMGKQVTLEELEARFTVE